MSIKDKLYDFQNKILGDLVKKEKELYHVKSEIDNLVEQARKEIVSESQKLDTREQNLIKERERIEKQRIKTETEIDIYREDAERRIALHIDDVIEYFEELESYGKDPKIVDAYINACYILDGKLARYFATKPRPNPKAANEILSRYRTENKKYLQRIMELEYQISELWAKDIDTSEKEDFEYLDDDEDRAKKFLSVSDLSKTETERNQKALENYLRKNHSKSYIGKMYERYIGYLYEQDGYEVEYRGIEMGLKDGGIDLVCNKQGEILLVQCKNWKQDSLIYEKHICQLYGATKFYDKECVKREFGETLFSNIEWKSVTPVFISTTNLDNHATIVAKSLGVVVRLIPLNKDYPIIKCNINNKGEKIYHLPFDQMYDKTKICKKGECWVRTVKEAEDMQFRRAMRHYPEKNEKD